MNSFFSAYFTNVPLVVNSSDSSIKFIFSLGGTSTPNMISLSIRRQIPAGPLQIRPSDSLVYAFKTHSHRGNVMSFREQKLTNPLCRRSRKMKLIFLFGTSIFTASFCYHKAALSATLMGANAEPMHFDPSAA